MGAIRPVWRFGHEKVEVLPIPVSHPNRGFGFTFLENGKRVVFLTDHEFAYAHPGGLTRQDYGEWCQHADLLIHDAQYTQEDYTMTRGWGHSTYPDATQLAIEADVKEFCLFHHDPDRTDEDLDRQVAYCNNLIQKAGSSITCYAAAEGMEITL
jgi:ribonuclease BN (tRNA processing enzyme)